VFNKIYQTVLVNAYQALFPAETTKPVSSDLLTGFV